MSRDKPRLRSLERIVLDRGEERLLVLHDPLGIADPVAVDADFAPVLDLLAGERSLPQIRQSLMMRSSGLEVELEDLEAFVEDLSASLLLDDQHFRAHWEGLHRAFLAAPELDPCAVDLLYPNTEAALCEHLPLSRASEAGSARALWIPEESLERCAPLVDELLAALPAADQLDLVVLLGADQQRGLLPFAVTDKRYPTPYGALHADTGLVEELEGELPWLRREEIRHRSHRGLEFAGVLLKHVYRDACPPVLPISCGPRSLDPDDAESEAFFDTLELALTRRRTLFLCIGSLSHCGPAYGETEYDPEQQRDDDAAVLDAFLGKSPARFRRRVLASPKARARGAAPALALCRLLDPDDELELSFYQLLAPPGLEEHERARAGGVGCAGIIVRPG